MRLEGAATTAPGAEWPAMGSALLRWLEGADYRVGWAQHSESFVECLIARGAERWVGRGLTREDARDDALRAMFPSAAARRLADAQMLRAAGLAPDEAGRERAGEASPSPRTAPVEPSTEPDAVAPASRDSGESAEEGLQRVEAAKCDEPPQAPPGAEGERGAPPESAGSIEAPSPAAHAAPQAESLDDADVLAVLPEPTRRREYVDEDQALERLGELRREIDERYAELGLATPKRQRLVILAWIAAARHYESLHPDDERIVGQVREVAQQLQRLCRHWWPGSIVALQRDTKPAEVMAALGGAVSPPVEWTDVRDAAYEQLEALESRDDEEGRDEYGWADERALEPPPGDPEGRLRGIARALEELTGRPVPDDSEPKAEALERHLQRDARETRQRLVRLAKQTRWLRGVTTQPELWAACMGRLRWAASRNALRKASRLRCAIDPDWVPRRSWADELGEDPARRERQRRRQAVWHTLQRIDGEADIDALCDLLVEAFDVFKTPELVAVFEPYRDVLTAGEVGSAIEERAARSAKPRNVRRRFRSLLKEFRKGTPAAEMPQDLRGEPTDTVEGGDVPERPPAEVAEGGDALWARAAPLREVLRGHNVLLVTNRNDENLRTRLAGLLDCRVDLCGLEPQRVQSAAQGIRAKTYDVVLAATGFLPHRVDGALRPAAREAGVAYVPVHKGRPATVVRQLLRWAESTR